MSFNELPSVIGFGIIGTGTISKTHADAIAGIPHAKLVAVLGRDDAKTKAFTSQHGGEAMTSQEAFFSRPDLHIVVISTPSGTHAELGIAAAKHGKHVIVEKPIDIDLVRADELIATCTAHNVVCAVSFQQRFNDAFLELFKAIREGRLGKLYYGASHTKWYRSPEYYSSSYWKGTKALDGGGALINQSIHYIDLLLAAMGDVNEVYGSSRTLRHDIEVEDLAVATLKFKNGALGLIEGSTLTYPGLHASLEIYGEKGTVLIKDEQIDVWSIDGEEPPLSSSKEEYRTGSTRPDNIESLNHRRLFADVIESIQQHRQPLVHGAEGRRSLQVIRAIYEASETGKPIIFN